MKKLDGMSAILLFIAVLCLSASGIFVKLADAPAGVTAFWRLSFTVIAMLPAAVFNKSVRDEILSLSAREFGMSVLAGFLVAMHFVLWFVSLGFTSIASSTAIVCTQPLFSLIFGFVLLREKVSVGEIVGCLIAIAGCFVIGYGDFQISGIAFLGDVLALLAAALVSLYYTAGQVVRRRIGSVSYSIICYSASVCFLFVYAKLRGEPFFGYPAKTWASFVGLALVSTICGHFIMTILLKKISASVVTMSILGEPIATDIIAFLVFGTVLTKIQFVGMATILGGIGLFLHSGNQRK